jgi:hypothetical protein
LYKLKKNLRAVADPNRRSAVGSLHNAALYLSARPDLRNKIRHCLRGRNLNFFIQLLLNWNNWHHQFHYLLLVICFLSPVNLLIIFDFLKWMTGLLYYILLAWIPYFRLTSLNCNYWYRICSSLTNFYIQRPFIMNRIFLCSLYSWHQDIPYTQAYIIHR